MLVRICILALALLIACLTPASADVFRVDLEASAQNYSGTCPIDIVFTATIDGDPGTVIKYSFGGTGFPGKKAVYAYIPTSGTLSLDDDITVDAAHAGTFQRTVSITAYARTPDGGTAEGKTTNAGPVTVVVTCLAPGQSPPPVAAPSPVPSGAASPAVMARATLSGVSLGENPATVLARLHLHPPDWGDATPPPGSTSTAQFREFEIDDGRADMMLLFDTKIEMVVVRDRPGKTADVADSFGIALGTTAEQLQARRGKPDSTLDPSKCAQSCKTIDEMPLWKGVSDPISFDRLLVYGSGTGTRWEYALSGDAVVSIRVVDCSLATMCASS